MRGAVVGLLVAALSVALAEGPPPPAAPAWGPREAVLAVEGLTPFTRETDYLSLEGFRRRVHPLKPDLIISRVVFEPARPRVGDLLGATIYYKNLGGQPARNFYLHLEPGTLGGSGFGLGGDFARLKPGEEKPYHWGAIRPTKPGLHTLVFSVDPERTADESNEHNNRHRVVLRVLAPGE